MEQRLIVSGTADERKIALLEDEQLVEYYVDRSYSQPLVGSIYRARVESVLPGMQAAFVDIGWEKNGYLPLEEAVLQGEPYASDVNIAAVLQCGQELLVQVAKEAVGEKGPKLTRKLTLPGRYVVFVPDLDYVGVSRKIGDKQQREHMKTIGEEIIAKVGGGHGIILRTQSIGIAPEVLLQDYESICLQWKQLEKNKKRIALGVIHGDQGVLQWVLRDRVISSSKLTIVVNQEEIYQWIARMMPMEPANIVIKLQQGDIFEQYGVLPQLKRALKRRVWLANGGYLVIDQMEALTCIDINTGKFTGKHNLQDTILQMNLEAVQEIAKQIRLRNIGGIILADFIDMQQSSHQQAVIEALELAFAKDKTKTHILGFTQLGLLEMTRKKNRVPLVESLEKECPHCQGRGRILSEVTIGLQIKEEIGAMCQRSEAPQMVVQCHPLVAAYLIGENGAMLRQWQADCGKEIIVQGQENIDHQQFKCVAVHQVASDQESVPVMPQEIVVLDVVDRHHDKADDGIGRIQGYVIQIKGAGHLVGTQVLVEITRVFSTNALGRMIK